MIKYLDLFSGIGAFGKAMTNIGIDYELVGFSEIDKWAIQSYCAIHNVEENLNLGDVREINSSQVGDVDIITHGSPCQDFSTSGKSRGGDRDSGTRSSLMWETTRIIKDVNPKYVIWENVRSVLFKNHIHNFELYLDTMETLGYKNHYKTLNAKDYGVPQNRERVFVVSIRKDVDCIGFKFPKPLSKQKTLSHILESNVDENYYINPKLVPDLIYREGFLDTPKIVASRGRNKNNPSDRTAGSPVIQRLEVNSQNISNTLTTVQKDNLVLLRNETNQSDKVNRCISVSDYRLRQLTPLECWRLMGFDDNDYLKAKKRLEDVFYNRNDRSNSQMYKQAGNSIVVPVLEEIFKNLFNNKK